MLDENVHFRHTARLATALIAAGEPFESPAADARTSGTRSGVEPIPPSASTSPSETAGLLRAHPRACRRSSLLAALALRSDPPEPMTPDPVLRHARREAIIIGAAWLAATTYCCTYCYLFGYNRAGRPLGAGTSTRSWACRRGSSGGSWSPGRSAPVHRSGSRASSWPTTTWAGPHGRARERTSAKGPSHE